MQPLRIDWTFTTPVVISSNYLQHLDALVAFAVCEEAREMGAADAIALSKDLSHVFEQACSSRGDVWKASALRYTPQSEIHTATMVRRTDPMEYIKAQDRELLHGRVRSHIDLSRGPDRNYFMYHSYQWMAGASAWCIADEDELRAALSRIRSLGKMTRNGFGCIKSMTIVPDADAHEQWMFRVLPAGMEGCKNITYVPAQLCLEPPYWDRTNLSEALEPIMA